ncbi:hypothetical protein N9850_01580 [Granulosicoccus sp.]|nr:hypothetical protein [Granulosicoccus sp.]MDB4222432.1 hypothetical protein [Granulosicoccus sp.]
MASGLLEKFQLFLYHRANANVSVTNAFRGILIQRGVDGSKIHVVTKVVDISRFSPGKKDRKLVDKYESEGKFVAGYIGTHGLAHTFDTILEAAQKLKALPNGDRYWIVLLGGRAKKDELKSHALAEGLVSVIFSILCLRVKS